MSTTRYVLRGQLLWIRSIMRNMRHFEITSSTSMTMPLRIHTHRQSNLCFSSSTSSPNVNPKATSSTHSATKASNATDTVEDKVAVSKNNKPEASSNPQKAQSSSNPLNSLGMSLNTPLTGKRSVIDALGPTTFTISGVRVHGSVLIMPLYSTLWNVDEWSDLKPEAFTLLKLALPKPDILILGCGATLLPLPQEVRKWFSEVGVNIEVSDTKNACHTFNVLNQESRNVAAALLPHGYNFKM